MKIWPRRTKLNSCACGKPTTTGVCDSCFSAWITSYNSKWINAYHRSASPTPSRVEPPVIELPVSRQLNGKVYGYRIVQVRPSIVETYNVPPGVREFRYPRRVYNPLYTLPTLHSSPDPLFAYEEAVVSVQPGQRTVEIPVKPGWLEPENASMRFKATGNEAQCVSPTRKHLYSTPPPHPFEEKTADFLSGFSGLSGYLHACGFHAYHDFSRAYKHGNPGAGWTSLFNFQRPDWYPAHVIAVASGYGKVWPHELGWRSQFMDIEAILDKDQLNLQYDLTAVPEGVPIVSTPEELKKHCLFTWADYLKDDEAA